MRSGVAGRTKWTHLMALLSPSTVIVRLGVPPLRQSPVYHTIHIVTNTVVMGKNNTITTTMATILSLRHPTHLPPHLPQHAGGEGHGCSHQEAQQHIHCEKVRHYLHCSTLSCSTLQEGWCHGGPPHRGGVGAGGLPHP